VGPLVGLALRGGIGSVDDPSPELVALFKQIDTDPEWADWAKIEHGAEVSGGTGSFTRTSAW
jgi:hypothetical protein